MSKTRQASPAHRIWKLLDEAGESTRYCSFGTRETVLPGLLAEGVGPIGLPITTEQARALIAQSEQAPYGKGELTIVDTDVRRVWQLGASQIAFSNPRWASFLAELLEQVQEGLGVAGKVEAHFYKLLVYERSPFLKWTDQPNPSSKGEEVCAVVAATKALVYSTSSINRPASMRATSKAQIPAG